MAFQPSTRASAHSGRSLSNARDDQTIEMFERLIHRFENEWNEWAQLKVEAEERLASLSRELDTLRSALVKYRSRPYGRPAAMAADEAPVSSSEAVTEMSEGERSDRFAAMSLADACETVLREEGRPLRALEIVKKLLSGGVRTDSATPYNVIVTAMRRDKRFVRLEPGVWGLATRETGRNHVQSVYGTA